MVSIRLLLLSAVCLLCSQRTFAQQAFAPTNIGGPAMKYQGLRDTDLVPNAELREKGLKEWRAKRDTTLAKAKKLLEEKNYVAVNQLLFPYDYLGKSYFHSGLYQVALDCFLISYEQKKQSELLFFIGQCHEKMGNEKEANRFYKKGAKEGDPACKTKLEQ
jgi:tetratricopeptide (TPR) repeat protein